MTNRFVSNRRQLFGATGKGFLAGLLGRLPVLAAPKAESNIYQRIGVQPIINCKGTYTIISGSQSLPEVKKALDEASRHYVHLDELMEKAGLHLAELTGAEVGIVTAGCAAALSHITSLCDAESDPQHMQTLPELMGLNNQINRP